MRIIDEHAHIYPPKIEHKATQAIGDFYDRPQMLHNGSPEELLESGRNAGVTDFLVFSTATTPHQVESINGFIIRQCREHPEFVGAGTLHIDFTDYEKEIDRMYAAGLKGVTFHPDFQKFVIGKRFGKIRKLFDKPFAMTAVNTLLHKSILAKFAQKVNKKTERGALSFEP